jgi:hypothetical protein
MKLSVISQYIRAHSDDFRGIESDRTFSLWDKAGGVDAQFVPVHLQVFSGIYK